MVVCDAILCNLVAVNVLPHSAQKTAVHQVPTKLQTTAVLMFAFVSASKLRDF